MALCTRLSVQSASDFVRLLCTISNAFVFCMSLNLLFYFFSECLQNYLKEAWNIFDFVTVLGSITDILVTELKVSLFHSFRELKLKSILMHNSRKISLEFCNPIKPRVKLLINKNDLLLLKSNLFSRLHKGFV